MTLECEGDSDTAQPVSGGGGGDCRSEKMVLKRVLDDAVSDELNCSICMSSILHKAVTLMPCLHNFCAGCYSVWKQQSNACPQCRSNVETITRRRQMGVTVPCGGSKEARARLI
jgi:hypothetical protein